MIVLPTIQKPLVVVSNLRKQHTGQTEGLSVTKTRKVGAKNISFCVRKGIFLFFYHLFLLS